MQILDALLHSLADLLIYRIFVYLNRGMKVLMFIFLFSISAINSAGQKTLLMEKIGTSRKFYYKVNDDIKLKTEPKGLKYKGQITSIFDSSVCVGNYIGREDKIFLSDICFIYRVAYFPRRASQAFLIAGSAYFILDAFNNLINNEQVIDSQTLIIAGSLIGVSLILIPISHPRYAVGLRWKLKVLDLSLN